MPKPAIKAKDASLDETDGKTEDLAKLEEVLVQSQPDERLATATSAAPLSSDVQQEEQKQRPSIYELRHDPSEIRRVFEHGVYPYKTKMKRQTYEKQKSRLQVELLKAQKWVEESGEKVILLFEGRDAAGKGGTIKRFMEHLNPRTASVVALNKPTDRERTQWYYQRYVEHLPAAGEMVLFDRSWYNRAGVERVMGFCSPSEYLEFMRQDTRIRTYDPPLGYSSVQILVLGNARRTAPQICIEGNRPTQTVEALPGRQGFSGQMGSVY